MERKILVLTFADSMEKPFRLRVEDPKESLSEIEVKSAMETILGNDVFPAEGSLARVVSAEIYVTSTQEIFKEN